MLNKPDGYISATFDPEKCAKLQDSIFDEIKKVDKKIEKNQKIESFNTYLFIGPHPDDIEIGAGATVSKLIKLKKKVVFLICTDGRFGRENLKEDLSEEQLIERRNNKKCFLFRRNWC